MPRDLPDAEKMPLEDAVGQCFMVGHGPEGPDAELRDELAAGRVGGVILFARNGHHLDQMTAAVAAIREASAGWPLVALDQEGGPVLRVREGASDLPAAMALGAADDPQRTREIGAVAGRELMAMGADMNLAPVLDVNRLEANPGIGLRSFGMTPDLAARHGAAFIEGLQGAGALGCAKHFPGKGASAVDAHLAMARVACDIDELLREDLPPFAAAVNAGAAAIMTSHVEYPALDPAAPGTLSDAVVELARGRLGFRGLVLSDDLEMGAMKAGGDPGRQAVRCLASGHDLLLVCHSRELHAAMRRAVARAVRDGELPEARVREAAGRVLAAKRRVADAARPPLAGLVETHRAAVDAAHRAGVTRLDDGGPAAPVDGPWTLHVPRLEGLVQVEEGCGSGKVLEATLREALPGLEVLVYDPKSGEGPTGEPGGPVAFASYNAHLFEGQAARLRAARDGASRFGLIALRNPFDARLAPDASPLILALGFGPGAQRAAGRAFVGAAEAPGRFRFRDGFP